VADQRNLVVIGGTAGIGKEIARRAAARGDEVVLTGRAVELAPIRVNAIHPGIVGDSPYWSGKPPEVLERYRSRTPTGRLATMGDIAHAVEFLLWNAAVNGVNLDVNGGTLLL
jgi:NAD(P)-dependent dehydrogenase (short-subunit alcohol dehydrogenase family)